MIASESESTDSNRSFREIFELFSCRKTKKLTRQLKKIPKANNSDTDSLRGFTGTIFKHPSNQHNPSKRKDSNNDSTERVENCFSCSGFNKLKAYKLNKKKRNGTDSNSTDSTRSFREIFKLLAFSKSERSTGKLSKKVKQNNSNRDSLKQLQDMIVKPPSNQRNDNKQTYSNKNVQIPTKPKPSSQPTSPSIIPTLPMSKNSKKESSVDNKSRQIKNSNIDESVSERKQIEQPQFAKLADAYPITSFIMNGIQPKHPLDLMESMRYRLNKAFYKRSQNKFNKHYYCGQRDPAPDSNCNPCELYEYLEAIPYDDICICD